MRDALIAAASADSRITNAALSGSAALGAEDRWSYVDLALGVAGEADRNRVVADWTDRIYRECGAVHHLDVNWGDALFRVFLLGNTLQVDLAFWPAAEFGAIGPTSRLLFGAAKERPMQQPPDVDALIGMGWLHALHARSSIARGRVWQAEYMLSGMRDHVLALACLRHGVPAVHGRGIDSLPPEVTATVPGGLVRSLDAAELWRAFGVVTDALIVEIERSDSGLANRLAVPLKELTNSWRLLYPRGIAVEPLRRGCFRSHPRGGRRRGVEGDVEGLADQLQAVEVARAPVLGRNGSSIIGVDTFGPGGRER